MNISSNYYSSNTATTPVAVKHRQVAGSITYGTQRSSNVNAVHKNSGNAELSNSSYNSQSNVSINKTVQKRGMRSLTNYNEDNNTTPNQQQRIMSFENSRRLNQKLP